MKIKKIIICLLILILINGIFCSNFVNASSLTEIISSGKSFLEKGDDTDLIDTEALKNTSSEIYNILLAIGIIVAVAVGAFLGVHFIMESAEGKAKVAEALVPYVVGCIVVFGAFTIWKAAINMGTNITNISDNAAQSVGHEIAEGNIDPADLSDAELKAQFSAQCIYDDLYSSMYGDTRNPTKPRDGTTQYMTLDEAVAGLSDYKKKIYNECKSRGLLDSNGYSLK